MNLFFILKLTSLLNLYFINNSIIKNKINDYLTCTQTIIDLRVCTSEDEFPELVIRLMFEQVGLIRDDGFDVEGVAVGPEKRID